ncbi:MAG: phage/plasmid primase, P4 family [Sciscionella sp.]
MNGTAFERLREALESDGRRVTGSGDKLSAQCPAHDDGNASLSVTGIDGQVLVYCHAGCDTPYVLAAVNLTLADLFDSPRGAEYRYPDGRTVHRSPNKDFYQSGNTKGNSLYRQEKVKAAVAAGKSVYVVEGEKDVHALESLGVTATCSPMGALKAHLCDWTPLRGAQEVLIIADNDEPNARTGKRPGEEHARQVLDIVTGLGARARVFQAKTGKDAADHVAAGYTVAEFVPVEMEPSTAPEPSGDTADGAGEEFPPPFNPMAVARALLPTWQHDGQPTLRHWRGVWMRWDGPHWAEADDKLIRSAAYRRLEHAYYMAIGNDGKPEAKPWAPTKRKIGDLLEAQAAIVHLESSTDAPSWTGDVPTIAGAVDGPIVACRNGLLVVPTRKQMACDPRFFNLVSVPFDYDPAAPEPAAWLAFLGQLWPDDPEAIAALQEFFGYVLSGRTDLHKIMLIVGPTRSGKGTIARVLTALIGAANAAGPTLASLCANFGMQSLLGKPLAVISDARLSGHDRQTVVERLLTVSGEDSIDVDRKYRDPWTGKLPTRFLILSNELPSFGDSSGVIAHRFIVLSMQRSWLGCEDTALTGKLTTELPGILNWALDGLDRLAMQGRLTEPASSAEAVISMKDNASPTSAFVREHCTVAAGAEVEPDELFTAWKSWCEDNERKPGNKQIFGRNLRSAVPSIKMARPREGEQRPRRYQGLTLKASESYTHNGADRGPSRTSGEQQPDNHLETPVVRDGPRSNQLWAVHEHECTVCHRVDGWKSWPEPDLCGQCATCEEN